MPITFYTIKGLSSPPARAVEVVIKILNLKVERREVDLLGKEHLEPWFLKLNPAHQVPVLNDNGYVLTDSHAIMTYLLTVYGSKEILEQYYPTDPKQRGIIDSRLQFDGGILFARLKTIFLPLAVWGEKHADLEKTVWMIHGVEFLDKILEGQEWLAGDHLTIADISNIMSLDLVEVLVPLKYYKNVSAWAERVRKTCPFYNEVGIKETIAAQEGFRANFDYDAEARWKQIKNEAQK